MMEPKGVKGAAELMKQVRGFVTAFNRAKIRCPECGHNRVHRLSDLPWLDNGREFAKCRCPSCKHRFLVEVQS